MQYYNQAINKLNSFVLPWNKDKCNDECLELFIKSGNIFKAEQNYYKASKCYENALNLCDEYELIRYTLILAEIYKNIDIDKAIFTYESIIPKIIENGNNRQVFDVYIKLAGLSDTDCDTIKYIKNALNFCEENITYVMTLEKLIDITQDIEETIFYFEKMINITCDKTIGAYKLKDYIVNMLLCYILIDILIAREKFNDYVNSYVKFADSSECKFIDELIDCVETGNVEKFTKCLQNFNNTHKFLTNWRTNILLKIKSHMECQNLNFEEAIPDFR